MDIGAAIKRVLLKRGTRHMRHRTHGVASWYRQPFSAYIVATCRCGHVSWISDLELMQLGEPSHTAENEKRRRRLKAQAREVVLADAQRREYEHRYLWYMATGEMRRRRDVV